MTFNEEPTHFEKTILSDLQGAWSVLRSNIANGPYFDGCDRLIYLIDEAMSWEVVRDLKRVPPLLLNIKNIAALNNVDESIMEELHEIEDILKEIFE